MFTTSLVPSGQAREVAQRSSLTKGRSSLGSAVASWSPAFRFRNSTLGEGPSLQSPLVKLLERPPKGIEHLAPCTEESLLHKFRDLSTHMSNF